MKLLRLAVLAAAAYGVKKWLDENPNAKRQVQEAADNAKLQAKHAVDQAKQEVDKRRQGGESPSDAGYTADSEAPETSMFGEPGTPSTAAPTTGSGFGADVPTGPRNP